MNIYDKNKNYGFAPDSFELVERTETIHDKKLETKATTFAKDALKRFAKNKSSVVGAVIIAVLLLGSFIIPAVSPYPTSGSYISQSLLPPKLFKAGTGFWDGTKKFTGITYDGSTDSPSGFKKEAVLEQKVTDVQYIDQTNEMGVGGYLVLTSKSVITASDDPTTTDTFSFQNYKAFEMKSSNTYTFSMELGNENNLFSGSLTKYKIDLIRGSSTTITLKDWSSDYSKVEINMSSLLEEKGENTDAEQCSIKVIAQSKTTPNAYISVKSAVISSSDEEENEKLLAISMTDANENALIVKDDTGHFPDNYWRSNGVRNVHNVEIRKVDFTYDYYYAALGDRDMDISGKDIQDYIDSGWCEYDFTRGPESFSKKSDRCPVNSIEKQAYNSSLDAYTITANVTYYKYLGYKNMPSYIFGTDANGIDLFTKSMNALKTSLMISTIASAICLVVGLLWGSISGYFGGTVDLIMERVTDIISGIPWIVLMTLIILHMGQTLVTFAFALCLTDWIGPAGTTRTQFYRFKRREYVLASRTLGASDWRLIFKHILPNGLGTIVTSCVLMIPSGIFAEASISYLGLGLKGVDAFGVILSTNQQYLQTRPMLILFPSIIISLLMISFNLFGNGLRDALNPSLKGNE